MFNKLLKAIHEEYNHDSIKPSVAIAYIKDGLYYAAVHRYHLGLNNKTIVVGAKASTAKEAVQLLAKKWLTTIKQNHVSNLERAVNEL